MSTSVPSSGTRSTWAIPPPSPCCGSSSFLPSSRSSRGCCASVTGSSSSHDDGAPARVRAGAPTAARIVRHPVYGGDGRAVAVGGDNVAAHDRGNFQRPLWPAISGALGEVLRRLDQVELRRLLREQN